MTTQRQIAFTTTVIITAMHLPSIASQRQYQVAEAIEIGKTFAATQIAPTLLTHDTMQYVAYYDENQQVTIAQRHLGANEWNHRKLPQNANWNNHVGVNGLIIDKEGYLHLSGNMHARPLVYWRTDVPYHCLTLAERGLKHIDTLKPINHMVGSQENRVTYERFSFLPDGRLVFQYRDGGSGNGSEIYNVWIPAEKRWERLRDVPLFDGRGLMNAYGTSARRGPDGYFHLLYMWRNTSDARTNHTISHARSRDMLAWETITGERIDLPLTSETPGTAIDPVAPMKGLVNMGFSLGFDAELRPIASYHKYDADGKSQIYNARWETDKWKIYQTSDWDWRWEFGGLGAIQSLVGAGAIQPTEDGFLSQPFWNAHYGNGVWKLDPETLQPIGMLPPRGIAFPPELQAQTMHFAHEDGTKVGVRWAGDRGTSKNGRYVLRWESLPVNRDLPRSGDLPEPSTLTLYRMIVASE
jgi:hypothetical protein